MTDRIGNYELIHHLATGGMAEVWVGKLVGEADGRSYAIKRILPHLARENKFVEMFLDEARIASQLDHPNIVKIDELGESDGEYYIAMEYIEGADLAEVLDLAERLGFDIPIGVAIQIAIEVLDALGYAHDYCEGDKPLDIVHRDVSPHNVLVSHEGEVRLVDFGVAKAVERHSKTETGFVKGKLSYMSPEQIRQDSVDRRSDIFAVGVVLFELLTKETPFGRELTAVNAILTKEAPDPSKVRKGIPKELSRIILRALEKDEDKRYPAARQMAAELKNLRDEKYAGVDAESIGMMLAELHELTMSETLEYEAMRTKLGEDEPKSDETTVRAPTDEVRIAAETDTAPKRRPWIMAIVSLLFIGSTAAAFAFSDEIKAAISPKQETAIESATADGAEEPTTENQGVEIAANAKPSEIATAEEKAKIPNPFEEAPADEGYYFVVEDAESEIQEGDEVVLELDDEEIAQVMRFNFERTADDQHADFYVQRMLAEFAESEDSAIDPGAPDFDVELLDFKGPNRSPGEKKASKPKAKKRVAKKKSSKKPKKRVVKRKRKTTKKKLASKKKPVIKLKKKKKNKTDVIDKAIPGGF